MIISNPSFLALFLSLQTAHTQEYKLKLGLIFNDLNKGLFESRSLLQYSKRLTNDFSLSVEFRQHIFESMSKYVLVGETFKV